MTTLDAGHYQKFSKIQFDTAMSALSHLRLEEDDSILDIGCGDGRITALLSQRTRSLVLGIDKYQTMIDLAKKTHARHEYPNLDFLRTSAEEMDFPTTYDIAVSFSVIHWVADQERFFTKVYQHLREKGKIFLVTYPAESPYWESFTEILQSEKWASRSHYRFYKTNEYGNFAQNAGFKNVNTLLDDAIVQHPDFENLRQYVKGWLPLMVDLESDEEDEFFGRLRVKFENKGYINRDGSVAIPYKKLTIFGEKSCG